jgi:CBS domain containing-hemolysin-like protein
VEPWLIDLILILGALVLVFLNGFFVAAEFAMVKVRLGRIDQLIEKRRLFAGTAKWLAERLDASLAACQLGITMASLGLGWIGEPAFAHLVKPLLASIGVHSEKLLHGISFAIAFTAITALHLVVGEQAPKIFAIRRPEVMALWCAAPLKLFYIAAYPFLVGLNVSTAFLLRLVGMTGAAEHEGPLTEDELRLLLHESHMHGHLTRSEHRLLNAVFEFDDIVCRRVMLPRSEVVFFDVDQSLPECLELARRTKHTRYPLCDGSLDKIVGVIHMKDLVGVDPAAPDFDFHSVLRPTHKVPENMPISRVLRHFQATHQLLAFVVDEYGTTIGIVTLENVLEKIVGPVEDEFDVPAPNIVASEPGQYIVLGTTSVEEVEQKLAIEFSDPDMDTVAGAWMTRSGKLPSVGDRVSFDGGTAEVLEVRDDRAVRLRFTLDEPSSGDQRAAETPDDSAPTDDDDGMAELPSVS